MDKTFIMLMWDGSPKPSGAQAPLGVPILDAYAL
jgi:hypothetical protein